MNPSPSLQGALWSGNQQLATKKQLISSIAGLYTDIQDINLSTINVTTIGASTVNGSFISLSTLQFKALDIGGLNFSFDLGLGDAIGGALAGFGAAVGGSFVGLGTGVGLTVQGLTTGLASLVNGRSDNYINNSYFETVNGTTQLQISTIGDAFPLYSSIIRSVSSVSANQVPGQEILLSSFFLPGTTCIRSVSDPLNIITGNSNIASSTIQSFGEWVPFIDPTNTGEDIYARKAQFSSLTLSNTNTLENPILMNMSNTNGLAQILSLIDTPNTAINIPAPFSPALASANALETVLKNRTNFNYTMNYISTPFTQYTSTIGTYATSVFYINSSITSTLTTIPKFIYNGADFGGANFAVCESNIVGGIETGFLSSGTMDFTAQSSNILLQWGLAVQNRNSTIAFGTSKRVSWDNIANTSNFIDIPVPQSTIQTFNLATVSLENHPFESCWQGQYTGDFVNGGMSFAQKPMAFGYNTSLQNIPGYDYQFNGNVYVNGTIEADQLIALSTFTSTNIVNYFSTVQLEADFATIEQANISSLQTNFIGGDQISSFAIEVYNQLSQFTYVSTLIVDFQIIEGTNGGTTTNLNKLQGTSGINSFVRNYNYGSFSNLSTINHSTINLAAVNASITNPTFSTIHLSTIQEIGLTTIFNYPGAITAINTASGTTAPVVGIGFKAQINLNDDNQTRIDYNYNQITGTSNGSVYYPFASFDPTNVVPNTWEVTNVASISTIQTASSNVYFSTTTIPCQTYTSWDFNSTIPVYVSSIQNTYRTPDDGDNRQIGKLDYFNATASTSGFTALTSNLTLPFNDKLCKIDVTGCGYRNANRVIQAGMSLFVNGVQGYSLPLFNQENPFNYLYDPTLTFILDPRPFGIVNTLDVRFYLTGPPLAGEFPTLGSVYYSLM